MSGLYLPVIFMLFGLIMRGVAFEFRFKATAHRYVWDGFFFIGSVVATFAQGIMLGALVQGLEASNRLYTGGPFDWLCATGLYLADYQNRTYAASLGTQSIRLAAHRLNRRDDCGDDIHVFFRYRSAGRLV